MYVYIFKFFHDYFSILLQLVLQLPLLSTVAIFLPVDAAVAGDVDSLVAGEHFAAVALLIEGPPATIVRGLALHLAASRVQLVRAPCSNRHLHEQVYA